MQEMQAYASSIPRLGRSPGEGHDNSLQYSCLEIPMDRGGWQAPVQQGRKELDTTEVTAHTHGLVTGDIKMSKNWSLALRNFHSGRENNNVHYLFLHARVLAMPRKYVISFNPCKRPLRWYFYPSFRDGEIVSEILSLFHSFIASMNGILISVQSLSS